MNHLDVYNVTGNKLYTGFRLPFLFIIYFSLALSIKVLCSGKKIW